MKIYIYIFISIVGKPFHKLIVLSILSVRLETDATSSPAFACNVTSIFVFPDIPSTSKTLKKENVWEGEIDVDSLELSKLENV